MRQKDKLCQNQSKVPGFHFTLNDLSIIAHLFLSQLLKKKNWLMRVRRRTAFAERKNHLLNALTHAEIVLS